MCKLTAQTEWELISAEQLFDYAYDYGMVTCDEVVAFEFMNRQRNVKVERIAENSYQIIFA